MIKERAKQLNDAIFQRHLEIFTIRSLDVAERQPEKTRYRVISLKKDYWKTPEERTQIIYETIKDNLIDGEILLTDNRCFTVKGKDYEIIYCIESYKKNADKIWYIENGVPCSSFIRRMGCELAFKWLKGNKEHRDIVVGRIYLEAMIKTYPNPADRFIASVNIEKQFIKQFG